MGRDSSVGIATRWAIRGSNPGEGEIFRTCPDRPWGPPSLLYNGYRVFPGDKATGEWRWPPSESSDEVEGRVQLYISSLSGPSWPVLGRTTFIFTSKVQHYPHESQMYPPYKIITLQYIFQSITPSHSLLLSKSP